MFIIIDENMSKMDYEYEKNHSSDGFDPIEDVEIIAQQENWCMVSTYKLIPTLKFMQEAGWKIRELIPDDDYVA